MKLGPNSPIKSVFSPVENFSDQLQQFGRQVSFDRLPDFPLLLEREREREREFCPVLSI
jgi:hypothetical protein